MAERRFDSFPEVYGAARRRRPSDGAAATPTFGRGDPPGKEKGDPKGRLDAISF
jgi:hypothetical protein